MIHFDHYWQSPFVEWVSELPAGWDMFVFHMRESRIKAKVPGLVEALSLWRPFGPVASISGPLAETRGTFWVGLDPRFTAEAVFLLPRLGYSFAVDIAGEIDDPGDKPDPETGEDPRTVKWRGKTWVLKRVYNEDRAMFREAAPDKRVFLLEDAAGKVRPVKGYRGEGSDSSRRGLPVEDARQLVNLVSPVKTIDKNTTFLDPFAGAGGIIIEAFTAGYTVFSADLEKKLRHGLRASGALHTVADTSRIPFADNTFDAIASEPPYHETTGSLLTASLEEMFRVLKKGGRLAVLVAEWQAEFLSDHPAAARSELFLSSKINRKGTRVAVLAWEKPES